MKRKIHLFVTGLFSIATVLSGCGGLYNSNSVNGKTTQHTINKSQPLYSQKKPNVNWITVNVQQFGQLPVGMVGTSLSVDHRGLVIATGGYTGSASLKSILQVVPKVNQIANLPKLTHDTASGFIGQALYSFGGGQANSYNTIVRVQDGSTEIVGTLPRPLSDAVCAPWTYHGIQGLLLIGGYDGQTYRKNVDYFEYKNGGHLVHSMLFTLPVGLRYTDAIAVNGSLYLVGGQTPTSTSSSIYRWSPSSGVSVVGHLPEAIQKAAVFQTGGFLIVAGGLLRSGQISSHVYAIRLSNGVVKQIGNLPFPLADMGYAQVGTAGYLVGGNTGTTYSSKVLKVTFA